MKHIKKAGRVVCPVCSKSYTHSRNLKLHIVQSHTAKDIEHYNVESSLVVRENVAKKVPEEEKKTDLQVKKHMQLIMKDVDCGLDIF